MTARSSKRRRRSQNGGTYKPAEYHSGDSGRYSASPSGLATGAYGTQVARSQGVIHDGVAGPNLAYSGGNMMTGGGKLTHCRRSKSTKKSHKQKAGSGCSTRKGW